MRVPVVNSNHEPLMPTQLPIVKKWIEDGKAKVHDSGCILWLKAKTTSGYGHLRVNGKVKQAHRVVLEHKLSRPIADKMNSCHTCHNRDCVNENHLYEGTQAENIKDMVNAGRNVSSKGSKHGRAKLNEAQVLEIREKLSQGRTICSLAIDYGVSKSTIGYIKTNQTWSVPRC